nr:unnamed protein product [Spirometra erinaceieuropaei]
MCYRAPTVTSVRDPRRLEDGRPPPHSVTNRLRSRVSKTTVHGLLFAEDCALNVTTENYIRRSRDLFSADAAAANDNFGLTTNADKTVFMNESPNNAPYNAPKHKLSPLSPASSTLPFATPKSMAK